MPDPVDVGRLHAFCDGSADGVRTVIEIFLSDIAETITDLSVAVDRADAEAVRLLAHRGGGSSSACGATGLAALLRLLEDAHGTRSTADHGPLIRAVAEEFDDVQRFLRTYLEGLRT